jgi:diguanylate cyclase (GGDEF)-like protein
MRTTARLVQVGTPIALTVGVLLLALFGLIIRAHRRAVELQATHDSLTGLPNRTLFQRRCSKALSGAARTGRSPVVLLLDLDDFKQVNDTLGHHFGDQLLVSVAGRLAEAVRPGDTVARLGGDEFALLLADGGGDAGTHIADRIAALLERPFLLDGISLDVDTSIGIASGNPGEDVLTLIRHADTAMYVAKKYKLGHAHYTPEQDENSVAKLTLLSDVRRALDEDEFELHYQPKIAMNTGELIGVEALARWQHPTRGLVMPSDFIPATNAMSLCFRFTTRVIAMALEHSRSWLDRGVELPVAVNVSTRSLLDQRLPRAVETLLHTHLVPAHLLCLEITEDSIMADPDNALDVLTRIRQLGVKTSIDDFGTGYSSMSYLKRLPVDELKIDRSFVYDMATDRKNAMLVQSTIELGHNLGLSVTAEGVEDLATVEVLQNLSCDVAQGYYFAKPLTADVLASWIASRAAEPAAAGGMAAWPVDAT